MNLFEIARAHVNGRSIPHKINKSNQHAIAQIIKDQKKKKEKKESLYKSYLHEFTEFELNET